MFDFNPSPKKCSTIHARWLFHYSVRLECPTDPRISRTRKRKTPEPCIIGAVSNLTNLPMSTKSIDGPNRGHGNHHGRVAALCIARVRVADVEIIAAPRPGRRSRQFAVATLACWLIARLPPAPSPWQLWLSGLRSGCGGRSAALRPRTTWT
jgi:hypothetical protein